MSATIVESVCGKVRGEQIDGVYAWKGIPYAKPPVGSLRFRAPEKPESWTGIRDAVEFGPTAPQPSTDVMKFLGEEVDNTREDCLNLNIWSPGADDKRRPVMVWIHGGAYISGSGSADSYDGASFAQQGDVVVVTINYRLGIMGFLHLGEIGGKEYATSGNCGIQDQVVALQWVQDNIAAFGGDPNQVTIFGESAGAMCVGTLLAFPAAKGLFSQVILQSGAANNALSTKKATSVAKNLLHTLDVKPDELTKLAEMPIEKLIEASTPLPQLSLGPVVDGVSLPEDPEKALANGVSKDIPTLIGTNKDEFRLYSFFDPVWKNPDLKVIESHFQQTIGSKWPIISSFIDTEKLDQTVFDNLLTMHVFTFPALKMAELLSKQGAPVWMYRFDWQSPAYNGMLKACHAMEIAFVWNTLNKPGTVNLTGDSPDRQQVANQMHQAWIAFARNGNPNTTEVPTWPAYNMETRETMIFNTDSKVEQDPGASLRLNWEKMQS